MRGYLKTVPKTFEKIVKEYGAVCRVPSSWGNSQHPTYINGWHNDWLVKRLYDQWRYAHAQFTGGKPSKKWFFPFDDQNELDWKTTAMNVMNAEYSGNASYEWFEFRIDENGKRQMYRVNQFDRIKSIDDHRIDNPALDYLFTCPEKTITEAFREFKLSLEKKN